MNVKRTSSAQGKAGPHDELAGEVALAGAHGDRLVAPEVAHGDLALEDLREGAIAAILDRPLRAAHGGRGVPPARLEATVGGSAQPAYRALSPSRTGVHSAAGAASEAPSLELEQR